MKKLVMAVAFLFLTPLAFAVTPRQYDIRPSGGTGTALSPFTGWEANLATDLGSGATQVAVHFPAGYYTQTAQFDLGSGWRVYGDGPDVTHINSNITGTAFRLYYQSNLNSSPATSNNVIEDLTIENTNSSNTGSGILCVADGYTSIERVRIIGFRYGLVLNQSELFTARKVDMNGQSSIGLWIVNGPDYNTTYADQNILTTLGGTPSNGFTNALYFHDLNFNNAYGTGTAIADDGGVSHLFTNVHINGWANPIRVAGTTDATFRGGYTESSSGTVFTSTSTRIKSGTSTGQNLVLALRDWFIAPAAGQRAGSFVDGSFITLENLVTTNTVVAFVGVQNCSTFHANHLYATRIDDLGATAALFDYPPTIDMSTLDVTLSNGNFVADAAGKGLQVKEGSNARLGTATLSGGTVTVSNSSVTANTRILLTTQSPSGTVGVPYVSARTAGTSFTITSTSGSDASTVAYFLVEPAP